MRLGRLIAELVHDQEDEIAEHQVHDGARAGHGGPHGEAHEARLRDRRVEHPVGAKFLDQARENLEGRAGLGHVLAEDKDGLVAAHLFGQRLVHRL